MRTLSWGLALSCEWTDVTIHTLPGSCGPSPSEEHGPQMLSYPLDFCFYKRNYIVSAIAAVVGVL